MTQEQFIKRSLSKLKPGDVVVRHNGELCKILDIFPSVTTKHGMALCYRFYGFDVFRSVMRQMFDLTDDNVNQGYTPNIQDDSYASIHGYSIGKVQS